MTARSEREPEENEKPRTVSIPGRLEYPENLTPGKTEKGGLHPNLYNNQGRLTSHAEFFPDAENEIGSSAASEYRSTSQTRERDEFTEAIREAIIDLLAHALTHAAAAAKPHIKRWWADQAFPAIKSQWNKMPRRNKAAQNRDTDTDSQLSTGEASTTLEATVADSPHEAISVLDGNEISMSSAEARMRLLLALMARAFSEEQVRMVSNALIEDEDFMELKGAVDEIAPQHVANIIETLKVNPLLLNDETLTEMAKTLERNEKVNDALSLTNATNRLQMTSTDALSTDAASSTTSQREFTPHGSRDAEHPIKIVTPTSTD